MAQVVPEGTGVHGYADDHTLKKSFNSALVGEEELMVLSLADTLTEVDNWMKSNRLKLNPDKTEFCYFGSRRQLDRCLVTELNAVGARVKRTQGTKYLGIHLDQHLSFKTQIQHACRKASLNLTRISAIRKYLTQEACAVLVQSLVISHLDYGNICYMGLPAKEIHKLQRLQNMSARVVLKAGPWDSITQCLKDLHWLPCEFRIIFKALVLIHKAVEGFGPHYLAKLFTIQNHRNLRSSDGRRLMVPYTLRKTFAHRAISSLGPVWWNKYTTKDLHLETNEDMFKKKLKTHLFSVAFDM